MRYYAHRWLLDDLIVIDTEEKAFVFIKRTEDGKLLEDTLSVKPVTKQRINGLIKRLQRGLTMDEELVVDKYIYNYIMTDEERAKCRFSLSLDDTLSPLETQGNSLEEVLGTKVSV